MILYSQRDPRWKDDFVGGRGHTMAYIGCVVTSIAMLTDYFKPSRNPKDLLKLLKFTPDGRIFWDSCKFENFKFYRRVYRRSDEEIKKHIKDPNLAVILQVQNQSHWVVATGIHLLTGKYRIADPLFGDRSTMARYRDDITGAAYFIRK